jgi:hypothetical protein
MRSTAFSLAITMCAVLLLPATGLAGPIESRITATPLALPNSLEAASFSWCTWGSCFIGPRLYLAPRSDGSFLVGWTDTLGNGHVSVVVGASINTPYNFDGKLVRGLVAHDDGSFAVLLKTGVTLRLSKRAANGSVTWSTKLNSTIAEDSSPTGDHRLAYGDGYYAAYWSVHGISSFYDGHEGDQLTFVDDSGVVQGGGWNWGCSHSMAQLVGYHTTGAGFTAFCSTDCYPDPPGLTMNNSISIYEGDGNCAGLVSVQLGQMAQAEVGWRVVFNAQDTASSVAYGIGFARAAGGLAPSVVWLTSTTGIDERDPAMARIGTGTPERYLVGWKTESDGAFHLGVIDDDGDFLDGPEQLNSTGPGWGNRDDSFRPTADGAVTWVEGTAGSSTLSLYRYLDSALFVDGFESGDARRWDSGSP